MDSRKRPIPGRNRQNNYPSGNHAANGSGHTPVRKTPEEMARTRIIQNVSQNPPRPQNQQPAQTVRRPSSDNIEFTVNQTQKRAENTRAVPVANVPRVTAASTAKKTASIGSSRFQIFKMSIGVGIFLSILTLGLYQIYWIYWLVKNTKAIKKDDSGCAGEVLCLLFVPFYSLYWWYTRGKAVNELFENHGYRANSTGILYLILCLTGLGIVSMAIMQSDFNAIPQSVKKSARFFFALVGKSMAFIFTPILIAVIVVFASLRMIGSDSNPAAQELLVTTLLETGQLKFLANVCTSQENIKAIVDANKSETIDEDVDTSLIDIKGSTGSVDISGGNAATTDDSGEPIVIEEIAGASYHATMMIVKDPSRVSVATIYPWRDEGETLDQIANSCGAIGAINGGLYNSYNNSGGMPYGVVVSNHEIQFNHPEDFEGLVLIGLTDSNILVVIDINGWSAAQVEQAVAEKNIRDAVTFQEEATDANNHFVQLIINGEKRDLKGKAGSGLNPRTAIGQRADGTILMLVTDGRGKAGHLGASAADLIEIMDKYGAVNAVNLDGGSSSCMYYNGEYLMTSVTFYYSNASWKLPLAFVVK